MGGMDTEVEPVLEAVVLVGLTCLRSVMGGMDTEVEPVLEAVVLVGHTCLIL
jgi:hypothetical protein